ncbi:MAG: twin-arginine translocase subunit TatC [bacterium]
MKKDKKIKDDEKATEEGMGFLSHLEELRKRIVWAVAGLVIGCVISGVFIDKILEYVILAPSVSVNLKLQNLSPFGQPLMYFKLIFIIGIIISFPFSLYQLWKFIAPGLYMTERKWVSKITFLTSLCFLSGVAFAYFLMIPTMMSFAASFGTKKIENIIDVNSYLSFITIMLLSAGLLFELPMITFILAKFGMVTAQFMRKYRRHSIVVIMILAAALTPTTDPISMMLFAAPLFVLYEISIFIAKIAGKKSSDNE